MSLLNIYLSTDIASFLHSWPVISLRLYANRRFFVYVEYLYLTFLGIGATFFFHFYPCSGVKVSGIQGLFSV